MENNTLAMVFSAIALIVAVLSLYWNYRSHFTFPKSTLSVRYWLNTSNGLPAEFDGMEIVNHGPSDAVLTRVIFTTSKYSKLSGKCSYWDISESCDDVSGGEPISNEGDWARIIKPGHICFVKFSTEKLFRGINENRHQQLFGLGFLDSFERTHLMEDKAFRKLVKLESSLND